MRRLFKAVLKIWSLVVLLCLVQSGDIHAEPTDIAVYKSTNSDFVKHLRTNNVKLYMKGQIHPPDEELYIFITNKLIEIGVKFENTGPKTNNITLIFRDIGAYSYRMTRNAFPVNKSVGIMSCYDPNVFEGVITFKCDHVVFEYFDHSGIPRKNIFEFIWNILLNTRPTGKNGTFAFSPPNYYQVETQIKP